MPIEFSCSSCSSTLRVPEEHAGKQAKCPTCDQLNSIPAAEPTIAASTGSPAAGSIATEGDFTPPIQNPYAPTMSTDGPTPKSGSDAIQVFRPLYDSLFFLRVGAWYLIIVGVLYCISIIGLIIGWVPLWAGLCLKNGASQVENGYRNGDLRLLYQANANFATAAKILGIVCIIFIALMALYLVVIILAIIAGVASNV